MNPFHLQLLGLNTSQEIYDVSKKLVAGIDTEKEGYYFFTPYLASDYPMVVCDKTYFFLYSTHHDPDGGDAGGIYWGKGNDLELSDFEEVALFQSGYQAETPVPLVIDGKIGIFYHTGTLEPGNGGKQQTRLMTSVGGAELHLMTWVDEGRPLGNAPTDGNHTGYCMIHDVEGNNIISSHISNGGLPQPWWRSVSTDGGYTFSRDFQYDPFSGIEAGYFFQPSFSKYFNYLGEQWWLGQIHPSTGTNPETRKKMIIAKSDTPFGNVTQKAVIFPEIIHNVMGVKIVGDTAYIYFIKEKSALWLGKYDLKQLENYL